MKRSLVVFVALGLAVGVLNCGGSDSSESNSGQDEVKVEDEGKAEQAAEESTDTESLVTPTPDQREEEHADEDDASITEMEEEEEEIVPQVEEVPAVLVPGYGLPIRGSGFAPNSLVEIWLYSDPIQLGEFLTDEEGTFSAEIEIPESVPLGDHTLEMEGEDVSGEPVTVSTPVVVGRDTEPPTLSSVSLSTGNIDVSNGERTVTVTVSASDEKLGVNSALFKFSGEECSEEGGYLEVRWPYLDWPGGVIAQKVSGTNNNGTWQATVTVPSYTPSCTIVLTRYTVCDIVGNCIEGDGQELGSTQPSLVVTNNNYVPDTEAPVLTGLSLSSSSLDVSSGAKNVTVTISGTDNRVGINSGLFKFSGSGCSSQGGYLEVRWPYLDWPGGVIAQRISGSNTNGTWQGTVTIPSYIPPCTIGLDRAVLCDNANNCAEWTSASTPVQAPTLTVANSSYVPDTLPPTLSGLSFSTNSVDVSNSAANVTLTIQGADEGLGISAGNFTFGGYGCDEGGYMEFRWPTLDWPGGVIAQRISGSNTNGTWQGTVAIPTYTPPCTIIFQQGVLCDSAGNCSDWFPDTVPVSTPSIVVTNANIEAAPPAPTPTEEEQLCIDQNGDWDEAMAMCQFPDEGVALNCIFYVNYDETGINNGDQTTVSVEVHSPNNMTYVEGYLSYSLSPVLLNTEDIPLLLNAALAEGGSSGGTSIVIPAIPSNTTWEVTMYFDGIDRDSGDGTTCSYDYMASTP